MDKAGIRCIAGSFQSDCEVFFVFNGTAANSLALSSACRDLVPPVHLETDECGAPEFFSNGSKVLLLDGEQGKICPKDRPSLSKAQGGECNPVDRGEQPTTLRNFS